VSHDGASYYGRPVLKRPVWQWMIPAYFFAGGVAGVSSSLAAGAECTGRPALARVTRLAALAGIGVGAGLLVADLGRPSRFANMLRVLRPTSPMSVGSWLLAGYGPAVGLAAAPEVVGRLAPVGKAATAVAGVLGPAVATYTAVLVSDTAVPAWHEAYRELPFVFAGGAAASAGGLAAALAPVAQAGPARRLAVGGAVVELAALQRMEQRMGEVGEVYTTGPAGVLTRLSKVLVAVGTLLMTALGRRRAGAVAAGGLLLTGAAVERFAVVRAGFESAADPAATVGPQRRRVAAAADGRGAEALA
jgi:formate-dependent nitrite reductase membrane component NrfD